MAIRNLSAEHDWDYLYKVDLSGSGTPEIVLPVTDYDYGPIVIGDSSTWNVTIQNAGVADLIISNVVFTPPADLSNPDALPITIPPAGNAQLALVYSPTAFTPLNAIATVSSNDPIHPDVELTLTGHGVYFGPTIDILQPVYDYGQVRVNATTRWYMTIRNAGSETLTIDDITSDDSHFYIDDATTLPVGITPLSTVAIGVWYGPNNQSSHNGTVSVSSNDPGRVAADVTLSGEGLCADYAAGQALWSHVIDTSWDNTPKAIASIPDVSGDGVADVIVCSEDDYVRCFNGASDQTADILWEHEIYAGAVYAQNALQITEDIDGDGYNDLVVGAAWGADLIRAISGKTGQTIWTHDTHEYGDGGWIYALDCQYDYNNDGVADVLAATGNDGDNTGPKRAYGLDGLTGISIWETPLGGAGFSVIGVDDFNGDGQRDVVAGASNADETQGWVFGIDGANGQIKWSFQVSSSSVWALGQIHDITGDGVSDIIVGDFSGSVYGLDATTGDQEYTAGGNGTIIRLERLDDVNGDGHPDFIPAHFGTTARVISGQTGQAIWATPLVDKSAAVDRIADVTGDGINDVVVGTLFTNNYVYLLDGMDGAVVESLNYGTPLDSIAAIPDIVGDGRWEMMAGGRDGRLTCFAGSDGNPCSGPRPPTQAPAPHDILKNRYISIDPRGAGGSNVGKNLDIRLTLTSTEVNGVPAGQIGSQWWANTHDADCIAIVGPTRPPMPLNWDACPTLHLTGCPIIPTSMYDIVVIEGIAVSEPPLVAATQARPGVKWWGDCVGVFNGTVWTPPQGVTNIDDAVAAIKTWQGPGGPDATHVSVTDVHPNQSDTQINAVVNFDDVFQFILAFQGNEYPGPAIEVCPDP